MDRHETIWAAEETPATGPLAGIRVLDLTTVLMGPSATQMLGDLGADVVKIESPEGDVMRWVGPWRRPGMGPLFLWANRNKRSLVLDLKSAEGRAAMLDLAAQADILVSNVRPQALARLGLDDASIRARNEKIIYVAAVGYGAGGPAAGKAAYDDLVQAASGLSGLFGAMDGTPRYVPLNLCDRIVGLYVANAVTAALFHRERSGQGQEIEVPMFETMAQFVLADHIGGAAFIPAEGPMGYQRLLSATRGPFRTTDGFIAVVVYTNKHWNAFAQLIGQPGLLQSDARFATQQSRTEYAGEIGAFLAGHFLTRGTAEWLALLHGIDIPAGHVNAIEDLVQDEHLTAVDFFEDVEHPTEGTLKAARFPIRFTATPASTRRLAPNLGAHTKDFLKNDES